MDQPSGESLTLPVQEHSVEVIQLLPPRLRQHTRLAVSRNKPSFPETTLTLLDHQLNILHTTKNNTSLEDSNFRIMLNLFKYTRRSMPKKFMTFIFNTFKMVDEAVTDRAAFLTPTGYVSSIKELKEATSIRQICECQLVPEKKNWNGKD